MMTRQDMMNASDSAAAHRAYYGEIADKVGGFRFSPDMVQRARQALANGDVHLNTIPLRQWDSLVPTLRGATAALKARGDYLTLATGVCILKEAMCLLIERQTPKGIRTGTAHFVSEDAACDYYARQGDDIADVLAKIEAGEIHIGKPEIKEGQRLSVIKGEGRYQIEE